MFFKITMPNKKLVSVGPLIVNYNMVLSKRYAIPCCKGKAVKHFRKEIIQANQELELKAYIILGGTVSRKELSVNFPVCSGKIRAYKGKQVILS